MRRLYAIVVAFFVLGTPAWGQAPVSQIFDSFGDVCCDDEKARLDNFAMALTDQPASTGYIIYYGGRRYSYPWCDGRRELLPQRGQAQARAARLKPYLVRGRRI